MGATIKRLIPLLALLLAIPCFGAIGHDIDSDTTQSCTIGCTAGVVQNVSTFAWTVAVNGPNPFLQISVDYNGGNSGGGAMSVSSVTCSCGTVTFLAAPGYNWAYVAQWEGYVLAPSTGTATITVNMSEVPGAVDALYGAASSYKGTNQSALDSTGCTGTSALNGTTMTCNVTTVTANAWILDSAISYSYNPASMVPSSPQVTTSTLYALSAQPRGTGTSYQGPVSSPGSVSDTWTNSNNVTVAASGQIIAFSIKPAAGATNLWTPSLLGADVLDRIEIIGYMFLIGISLGHARSKQLEKRVVDDGGGCRRVLSGSLHSPAHSFVRLAKGSEAPRVHGEASPDSQRQERNSESGEPNLQNQFKIVG